MAIKKYILLGATLGIISFQSCMKETPFETEGESVLQIKTEIRSDFNIISRASIDGYDDEYLNQNLVVYIENSKGVIRKYIGKDQIPQSITLPIGSYVIEGWTGDSVSASWDKKFFRGYEKNVNIDQGFNEMSLKLDIANVLVSVDPSSIEDISDLNVKFYHSRGELNFTEKEIQDLKRGYFMMPNADSDLHYVIEGRNKLGESFSKSGDIKNVERAHLYNLKLTSEQPENTLGGAIIRLTIEDIPVIDQSFEILPAPSFKAIYGQYEFDLDRQISSTSDIKDFKDLKLRVLAYEGLQSLKIKFDKYIPNVSDIIELELTESEVNSKLQTLGIDLNIINNENEKSSETSTGFITAVEAWLSFPESFFSNLPSKETEYIIELSATDNRDYTNVATIKIANTENALADPIFSESAPDQNLSPMAILANSAELSLTILNEDANDFGIMYREINTEEFYKVSAKTNGYVVNSRASSNLQYKVLLTNLKIGTTYEYKAYSDQFEESSLKTFITEETYNIPNSDMSSWSKSGEKYIPSASGKVEYWDNGNHGSLLVSSSLGGKNISMPDDTFLGDGNIVGKLQSNTVLSVLAAGNLFIGEYISNDGTSGADLNFGREFNGSHPSALKVKVNYRPGTVDKYKSGTETEDLIKGGLDHGQIFVAIANSQAELHTAKGVMFDPNADNILGYGQITFKSEVAPNNSLEEIIIPIEYYSRAKVNRASHLIIVCSASKYGDYFTGSSSSTMYVDDFELEYGDIQWAD